MVDAVRYKPFALVVLAALALAGTTQKASADRVVASTAKAGSAEDLMVERGERGSAVRSIQSALGIPATRLRPQTSARSKQVPAPQGPARGRGGRPADARAPASRRSPAPPCAAERAPAQRRAVFRASCASSPSANRAANPGPSRRVATTAASTSSVRGNGAGWGDGRPREASEAEQDAWRSSVPPERQPRPPNCPWRKSAHGGRARRGPRPMERRRPA